MENIIIDFLAKFPAFFWLFTILATGTAIITIAHAIAWSIAKSTKTKKDDDYLRKLDQSVAFRIIIKIRDTLKRFSLLKNT